MRANKQERRAAKRLYRFCLVNGVLDENRVRQVAQRLGAAGGRESAAVLAHFLRLVKLDHATHTAVVQSAVPLSADLQAAIQAGLNRRYGAGLAAEFSQRPELLGGVRVQVGCDVYDGSVRAKLAELARSF